MTASSSQTSTATVVVSQPFRMLTPTWPPTGLGVADAAAAAITAAAGSLARFGRVILRIKNLLEVLARVRAGRGARTDADREPASALGLSTARPGKSIDEEDRGCRAVASG